MSERQQTPSASLPRGFYASPCPDCELPVIEMDSLSAYGGRIRFGCGKCLLAALDALEGVMANDDTNEAFAAAMEKAKAVLKKYNRRTGDGR